MQSSSQNVTDNKPTPSFLQAGCPSCHPTNSVKALKGIISVYCKAKITTQKQADSRQHQKLTAVSNSLYLIHSLMTAAAVDAFVVQEHQTSVKANPELPTELQVITTLTQQTLTSKYTRL